MDNIIKWWKFVLIPEAVLGLVAYAIMASLNGTTALMSALYVAGIVAAILIIFAMIRNDGIGVIIATASLAMILAIFCSISGALVFTVALVLVGGALIFIVDRVSNKE